VNLTEQKGALTPTKQQRRIATWPLAVHAQQSNRVRRTLLVVRMATDDSHCHGFQDGTIDLWGLAQEAPFAQGSQENQDRCQRDRPGRQMRKIELKQQYRTSINAGRRYDVRW